jgi:hypothetical protein
VVTVIVSVEIDAISIISMLLSSLGVEYSDPQIVILNLPEDGNKLPSPVVTTTEVSVAFIEVSREVLALLEVFSQSYAIV